MRKRESKERDSTCVDSVSGQTSKSKANTEGQFSNYPELTPKTVSNLQAKGITSLFPI